MSLSEDATGYHCNTIGLPCTKMVLKQTGMGRCSNRNLTSGNPSFGQPTFRIQIPTCSLFARRFVELLLGQHDEKLN